MSLNGKSWKFKRALQQNEETPRTRTLLLKFLYDLLSDATKTSEGKVVFNFGIRLRHMKTENSFQTTSIVKISPNDKLTAEQIDKLCTSGF